MTAEHVDVPGVIARLAAARTAGPSAIAFDADGTLWSGDVGEDVFGFACEHGLLNEAPRDAMVQVAKAHGLETGGSTSDLGRVIYAGYRDGKVNELLTCEVMTWGYAGWTLDELRATARRALVERGLSGRVRRMLIPVFEFARREGLKVIVISASPHAIVSEALRMAEIDVDALAAGHPVTVDDRIGPAMDTKVPYGPEKPIAGAKLLAGHDWLGSFGDNVFDVEMLRAARIGVAVCPKPALVSHLHLLTNTVVLE